MRSTKLLISSKFIETITDGERIILVEYLDISIYLSHDGINKHVDRDRKTAIAVAIGNYGLLRKLYI